MAISLAAERQGGSGRFRETNCIVEKTTIPRHSPRDTLTRRYTDTHTLQPQGCSRGACTNPPWAHTGERWGQSRQLVWRKAPGRARAAGKLRPRLCRQPAVLTRRDAPDAAPTAQGKRTGCRVPLADPTLGALGNLHPPPRFPPLPAARGHLGIVHVPRGKSSQRQESSEPARVPRRQAGACTQRRTRT